MKRIAISSLAGLVLAAPAFGQPATPQTKPPAPSAPAENEAPDFHTGTVTFGLQQRDVDTVSSKFFEYRSIPNGPIAPYFSFQGKKGDYRYDFFGSDVTQGDQNYWGRFAGRSWTFEGSYTGIPHAFGNDGKSILNANEATRWRISDTLQSAYQSNLTANMPRINYSYLNALVSPTLDNQPATIDVALQRDRTNLAFGLLPRGGNLEVGVTYFHEKRSGTRTNNGTSFGFGNVIETADPIRYVTQDFGVNATLRGDFGSAFAGFNYNDFSDRYDSFVFENPFRVTDSTHPSAYQAPNTSTVDGPTQGRVALPPSNSAWTFKAGTSLSFGPRTRLSVDGQVGQWTQNEQAFIPFTTNTAIKLPDGRDATSTASLPAQRLDGKIDVLALNGFFTTAVGDDLRLNARYRLYKNQNDTPQIRFEQGYVRFDGVWEDVPRISVPYGFESSYLDVYATYDLGSALALEAGWKWNRIERAYRETQHTTENTLRLAVDLELGGGLSARGLYEFGTRDFDEYLPVEGGEHSFLAPGAPANHTALRRFDQAKRDRDRLGLQAQWSPGGIFSASAAYYWNKDAYDDSPVSCNADYHGGPVGDSATFCPNGTTSPLGLREAKYETFSLDADVTPSDKLTVYAFYSREDVFDYQTGTQSGSTVTFNPDWGWTSTVEDKVDSLGAGADVTLVPDKWFLSLFYRYQKVDGNNHFTAGPQARPPTTGPVEDIADYDDTTITHLRASLKWQFAKAWSATLGGWWEKYEYNDDQTGQTLYYMPSSFFLNPVNGNYKGWVSYASLTYGF